MGNDLLNWGFCMAQGTHPRSRGEHQQLKEAGFLVFGSSLLTRGTHRLVCANITQLRQIMEAQLNAYP